MLVATLIAVPYWGDRQMMRLLTEIYSFVALASLWNFLAGYAGLVSVGQQTFVGLGGYTLYLCALWAGINPMAGLPLAVKLLHLQSRLPTAITWQAISPKPLSAISSICRSR